LTDKQRKKRTKQGRKHVYMSVEVVVNVNGFSELQLKLDRLDLTMRNRVDEALNHEVSNMRAVAQSLAPKRTGHLASTVYAERAGEWSFKLGARAQYAYFVEFGTRFMRARRFLSRALESAMPGLVQRVSQAVREAIVEAGGT
jgi:HK97 gp10 family phage protein